MAVEISNSMLSRPNLGEQFCLVLVGEHQHRCMTTGACESIHDHRHRNGNAIFRIFAIRSVTWSSARTLR